VFAQDDPFPILAGLRYSPFGLALPFVFSGLQNTSFLYPFFDAATRGTFSQSVRGFFIVLSLFSIPGFFVPSCHLVCGDVLTNAVRSVFSTMDPGAFCVLIFLSCYFSFVIDWSIHFSSGEMEDLWYWTIFASRPTFLCSFFLQNLPPSRKEPFLFQRACVSV